MRDGDYKNFPIYNKISKISRNNSNQGAKDLYKENTKSLKKEIEGETKKWK